MAVHYLGREFLILLYGFFDIPLYDKTDLSETPLPIVIVTALSLVFAWGYGKVKALITAKFKRLS